MKKNDENKRERARKKKHDAREKAGRIMIQEKSTKYIQIERKGIQRNIYGKEKINLDVQLSCIIDSDTQNISLIYCSVRINSCNYVVYMNVMHWTSWQRILLVVVLSISVILSGTDNIAVLLGPSGMLHTHTLHPHCNSHYSQHQHKSSHNTCICVCVSQ